MRPKLITPALLTLFAVLNVVYIVPVIGAQIVIDVHSPGEGVLVISPDPAVGTVEDTLLWVIYFDVIQYSPFASHVEITVSTNPTSEKNPWGGLDNVTSPKLALGSLKPILWGEEDATNTCGTFQHTVKVYYEIDPGIFVLLGEKTGTLRLPCQAVGGSWVPVDKLGLLAPYIGLASTILVATAATAVYVKRVKRKKEK